MPLARDLLPCRAVRGTPGYLLALAMAALPACPAGPVRSGPEWECVWQGEERPGWLFQVGCDADFDFLSGEPLTPFFGNTDSVKFVIDLHEGNLLYFFDSERWRLHYDFCRDELGRPDDPIPSHGAFNQREYFGQERRFLLGSVDHYRSSGLHTIEFAAGDQITNEQIEFAYRLVVRNAFFGSDLRFRPVSRDQEERTRDLEIPRIGYDEIFEGQTYQPLNAGETYGYLRLVTDEDREGAYLGPRDIAVLESVPNDISVVAGLVTAEFQAPLSHVAVLSHNRGTPNMALRGALAEPRIADHADLLVRLVVEARDFVVEPATLPEAEAFWEARRPPEPFDPPLDETVRDLVDLQGGDAGLDDLASLGAKAANFAELARIEEVAPYVPAGFAIPVVHYIEHLERAGLDETVAGMLDDEAFLTDFAVRSARLAALRAAIAEAPVDPDLLAAIEARIRTDHSASTPMRFRSSSNAEDLAGFTGAGLYTSRTGVLDDPERPIADALRAVWASLWNDRAFEERDFYRILHEHCAMGVLVHPSFPAERANGVAITTNPFASRRPAYYVNVQMGEVSVVSSEAIPEQFLFYTFYPDDQIEYLSRSSLAGDRNVLSLDEIEELAAALGAIHRHFLPIYRPGASSTGFGMDVEFKIDFDRSLVVKQARPWSASGTEIE